MNYIGLITGLYNPIITNQNVPKEYQNDTINDDNYADNYCPNAAINCLYANDDMLTCLYIDNCPVNKR